MADDERVDVVDEADRVIGTVTRAEVRDRHLRHRAVYIVVLDDDGRLFVHRRTATKDVYPSFYDVCVGGVVGAGEGYAEAAEREVAEEIGVSEVELIRVAELRYDDGLNQVNGVIFECTARGPLTLQDEEIESGDWFDIAAVERMLEVERVCPDSIQAFRLWRQGRA